MHKAFSELLTENEREPFRDEAGNGAHFYACHAINNFCLRRGTDILWPWQSAIREHEISRFFQGGGSKKPMASLALFSGNVLHVDEALKGFIEWLEPGVHRFLPIEIRLPKQQVYPHHRYILLVEQVLDGLWPEMSGKAAIKKQEDFYYHSEAFAHMRQLAFRKSIIDGKHLWYERRIGGVLICLSDRLQQEIADAGLKIPKHVQMRELS